MTIDDALHFTEAQRAEIYASYKSSYERDARTKGIPQLGSGRVFPVNQDDVTVKAFQIPDHWPQLAGMDFGYDHPTAAVRLAWDRDNDVIYVMACARARENTPSQFAPKVRGWGRWIPFAWPHDGLQRDKGSGDQLAAQYREQGINMLRVRATFSDGTSGIEAGVSEMLDRMQTGRLLVFEHLADWFEEFNLYHRKDGLIVKLNDDLMSATRYGIMMRRFAHVQSQLIAAPKFEMASKFGRADGLGWMQ
jgi:hypothetical protein